MLEFCSFLWTGHCLLTQSDGHSNCTMRAVTSLNMVCMFLGTSGFSSLGYYPSMELLGSQVTNTSGPEYNCAARAVE